MERFSFISISAAKSQLDTDGRPAFHGAVITDMPGLAKLIVRGIWSPMVWDGMDIVSAHFAAFNFDEVVTLALAVRRFASYRHVIGTTRSHQSNDKGDRFRVIVPFEQPIRDEFVYLATMKKLVQEFNANRACVDTVRIYYPCVTIVSVNKEGKAFAAVPVPPDAKKAVRKLEPGPESLAKRFTELAVET